MDSNKQKKISARKLTVLLLLATKVDNKVAPKPINGTTRMQKYVFLISQKIDNSFKGSGDVNLDFNYVAEKFGPADLDLYQDLDFLRTMHLISWRINEELSFSAEPPVDTMLNQITLKTPAMLPEEKEEEELSFDYLMGMEPLELLIADTESEGERQYALTDKGVDLLNHLKSTLIDGEKELFDYIENTCIGIRQQFDTWTLRRLLKYVYVNYSNYTTRSIIKENIINMR